MGWSTVYYQHEIENDDINIGNIEILEENLFISGSFDVNVEFEANRPNYGRESGEEHFVAKELLIKFNVNFNFIMTSIDKYDDFNLEVFSANRE